MEPVNENISGINNSYGYIKDGKVFLKAFMSYPDREIGIVKESEEVALKYFETRYEQFVKKINDLFQSIEEAENKGSYLQKLMHLKDQIPSYDGLGDFETLFSKLEEKENELSELVSKNRLKNLAQKKALLDELKIIKESNDWINATEQVKEVKNKWIRIGSVEKVVEAEIDEMYQDYLDTFFKRRQEFYDQRNEINRIKLDKYTALANRAEEIMHSMDFRNTSAEFKKMQGEWKEIGQVPKKELEPIQKKFKEATSFFFNKIKEDRRRRGIISPEDMKLENHRKLLDQVLKLAEELPPYGDEEVKKLLEEWKKLGPVRSHDYKPLEQKFRHTCTKTLDNYFLNRIANKRSPGFATKLTPKEQIKFKIGLLKELIARDAEQIENFENSFSKQNLNSQPNSFDKVFGLKLQGQKRNLLIKQTILKEMEDALLKD